MVDSDVRQDLKSRAISAYEASEVIWPETDPWSVHTRDFIARTVQSVVPPEASLVLNAGCGGNDYGLSGRVRCVNLDIAHRQTESLSESLVGDVERLPLAGESFDLVICVGAVINYCEPYDAIPELARVLKVGGLLVVDFETTTTAEVLFSPHWGKRVSIIERLFADRLDRTYLFSSHHIRSILSKYGCSIIRTYRYHTATAIWRLLFPSSNLPRAVRHSDTLLSQLPGISRLSSNVIFVCQKH